MTYSIQQLARLTGLSVRTLHHYDAIGLLCPGRNRHNNYRQYGNDELLRLQQILFFRELDFSLDDIKRILDAPEFDMRVALMDQRKLIEINRKRLDKLIETIDKTIKKINKQHIMKDEELYGAFTKKEAEEYAEEARERWGNTDSYKQSTERVQNMTKEQLDKVVTDSETLTREIAEHMDNDPASEAVQELIKRHYEGLRTFYEPTLEMYRGLAEMYVQDPRFTAFYEKYAAGLAQFMHDAMIAYCDAHKK